MLFGIRRGAKPTYASISMYSLPQPWDLLQKQAGKVSSWQECSAGLQKGVMDVELLLLLPL